MPELEDIFGGTPTETVPEPEAPVADVPEAVSSEQAQPETPSQPSFATSGLYARAQAAGLPLDGIDNEASFAEALLDRYMQDRAYADLGRSSLATPRSNEVVDGKRQNNQSAAEQDEDESDFDPDSHFNSLWQVPQINEQAKFLIQQGIVELGENGLYQAKPGFESLALPVLNELNHAHVAQREQMQKLFEGNFYQNIYKGISPVLERQFQRMLEEKIQSQFQTYEQQVQAQSFEQKFMDDNKAWLYQPDGRLTADGEKFRQTVAELREQGITDPQRLANYALKLSGINTNAGAAPAPTLAPSTTAVTPADAGRPRDEHGRFVPAGTPAPSAAPKSKQESFIDEMRRKAGASSNQGSYTDNGSEFVPANEGELENMFTNAYRRHKTGAAA